MRQAQVLYKNAVAGILSQLDDASFVFRYSDEWFQNENKPAISLTLAKKQQEYKAEFLFSFFYNMLPEGSNKKVVCYNLRIDEKDHFGLLLRAAKYDTIGAVRLEKIEN